MTPTPADSSTDSANDATDSAVDSSGDTAKDTATETSVDSATDAPPDGAADVKPDSPTDGGDGPEAKCLATGGTVSSGLCCLSASDYPSSCLVGACGCAPSSSHTVKTCNCGTGNCFNPSFGCVKGG